jgi:hypothetical protein
VLQQKCLEYRIQGLSVRAIAEQLVGDKVVARIQKSDFQHTIRARIAESPAA